MGYLSKDSLAEAKAYIDNIDFSMIINKMVKHQGWLKKDALTICQMYRRFLFLNKKYSEYSLPPSEEIDEFWHNHILDTKKYREDCNAIFGYYLDHYPYSGIDEKSTFSDLESDFAHMQKLYQQEFNESIYQVKTIWSSLMMCIKYKLLIKKPKRVMVS